MLGRNVVAGVLSAVPLSATAAELIVQDPASVARAGVSGIWILANISYAGMRAQNSASAGWRIVAFIFGFPGTLVTFLAVKEGGERAYGVVVPRSRPPSGGA